MDKTLMDSLVGNMWAQLQNEVVLDLLVSVEWTVELYIFSKYHTFITEEEVITVAEKVVAALEFPTLFDYPRRPS